MQDVNFNLRGPSMADRIAHSFLDDAVNCILKFVTNSILVDRKAHYKGGFWKTVLPKRHKPVYRGLQPYRLQRSETLKDCLHGPLHATNRVVYGACMCRRFGAV